MLFVFLYCIAKLSGSTFYDFLYVNSSIPEHYEMANQFRTCHREQKLSIIVSRLKKKSIMMICILSFDFLHTQKLFFLNIFIDET